MKAILKFNLHEEQHEHECAVKGVQLAEFQEEVFTKINSKIKHGDLSEETEKELERIRNELADEAVDIDRY